MRTTCAMFLALAPFAAAAGAQRQAWVRFDEGCGRPHGASFGSNLPLSDAWAPGRWGFALKGVPVTKKVEYRWIQAGFRTSSSFSFAFWLKQRHPLNGSGRIGFGQLNVAIAPATGEQVVAGSQVFRDTTNLGALAAAGWAHAAVVFDVAAQQVRFFVNGSPSSSWPLPSTFQFGSGSQAWGTLQNAATWGKCPFDLDELAIYGHALSAQEVAALASQFEARDRSLGGGCGNMALGASGGPPRVGTSTYRLELRTPTANEAAAIVLGDSMCKFLGVDLPLDLGSLHPQLKGCTWITNQLASISGASDAGGLFRLPFVIPQNALTGVTLFAQAVAIQPSTNTISVSSGRMIQIGH